MSQWIKVEDKLPDLHEEVLLFNGRQFVLGFITENALLDAHFHGFFNIEDFTHWMPLPEPPKEEG